MYQWGQAGTDFPNSALCSQTVHVVPRFFFFLGINYSRLLNETHPLPCVLGKSLGRSSFTCIMLQKEGRRNSLAFHYKLPLNF